jgi:hypothetical protein
MSQKNLWSLISCGVVAITGTKPLAYIFRTNHKSLGLRLHQVPIKQNGSTTSLPHILDNVVLLLQWPLSSG